VKILVVDDDLDLLALVSFALRQAGYLVVEAKDGRAALAAFEKERPDLVILDVNLPHVGGLDVLKRVRAEGATTPVILLTVRSSEQDQVQGLDLGADDYLTKPFSPRTLLARVRAALRRAGVERPAAFAAGGFVLDADRQTVSRAGGGAIRLTALEFRLLHLLVANAGRTLSPERITGHVWGYRGMGDKQLLKQLVHRLRRKIEPDAASPVYLVSVPGVGYLLDADRDPSDPPLGGTRGSRAR
jgi:DNA-binding response OmpR family regulator